MKSAALDTKAESWIKELGLVLGCHPCCNVFRRSTQLVATAFQLTTLLS
jgi:hypothetical protein